MKFGDGKSMLLWNIAKVTSGTVIHSKPTWEEKSARL